VRKLLLAVVVWGVFAGSSQGATILINGVPVKELYVDSEGRLYLTPGPGRRPVKIEIPKSQPVISSKSKKLKVEGKAYLHYDAELSNPQHKNAFKITRNYVELRGYFSDRNYFRTTLDAKQTDEVDGGSYAVRVKYAYAYFDGVLPYAGVEVGMAHRPWIDWEEHHGWLHRDLEETFIENKRGAHLINSSDLGVNFKGKRGIASWEVGVFNGEGYHGLEESSHFGKSLEGRLSVNLFKNFTLSAHTVHSFDHKGEKFDRHLYQLHAVYDSPYFLIAVQYVWDRDDYYEGRDLKPHGYSVNADLKLRPVTGWSAGILGRYDCWDTDLGGDDERKHWVYGLFYDLSKQVRLTVAQDRLIAGSSTGQDDASTFMGVAQVKW